jgi:hypothetical protein
MLIQSQGAGAAEVTLPAVVMRLSGSTVSMRVTRSLASADTPSQSFPSIENSPLALFSRISLLITSQHNIK